ncbi:MAG: type II toxin-antitoxin system RelE/ParE family toxin [Actinomycetia bacterium]|nr:type II toxin-antitoxin system RelE/ParE family toxin [Actinomycetes bacterium]
MCEVLRSETFARWIDRLRDREAVARIKIRIARLVLGNPGDVKPVGGGVSELRIHHGPGYRVYFLHRRETVVILLCGGDKASQLRDIQRARNMAEEWRE